MNTTIMNFSFSEIIQYWDILKQYINPASIIWWGVLGACIGFIAMVILLIILRKKVLINRQHWTLKALAYAYLVFLPLWAGYSSMQWFALHNCERQIMANMPTYLGDANSVFNLYVKDYVTGVISERHLKLTGHEIIDKTVDYTTRVVSNTIKTTPKEGNDVKGKISDFLTAQFIKSDIAKNIIIDEIEKNIGKPLLMDKKLTRELLDVKINDLMDNGILNTVAGKHVKKLFGGFKSNVLLIFLLVLLIPIIEIIIAHYLEKKNLPPLPPDNTSL